MSDFDEFAKERDKAILSMDKKRILSFAKKYGILLPNGEGEFWAGIHKAVMYLGSATTEQKQKSKSWLLDHGFKPYIEW